MFDRGVCFAPRPIQFLGLIERAGWRLKSYSIVAPGVAIDHESCQTQLQRVMAELPQPAGSTGRPGVGFVIFHGGEQSEYLVLCWWDSRNELMLRVWVRPQGQPSWRPAGEGESICVWDLEVIWFERDAYVRHVLAAANRADLEGYLAERMGGGAVVLGAAPRVSGAAAGDRLELTDPVAYRQRMSRQLGGRAPLDVLGETPEAVGGLLAGVSLPRLRARPFPGKWTPLEVIGHLCDTEWVFGFRTRTIFADDRPELVGMDQDLWVAAQRRNEQSPDELAAEFAALRTLNLAFWRKLSPEALERIGRHRERGEEALGQILSFAAGHDLWHQDQFRRYLAAVPDGPPPQATG